MRGVVTLALALAVALASGCSATPTATVIPTATPTVTAPPGEAAILSHLYALEREIILLERFDGSGGAIESLGDELLVVTPKGQIALVTGNGEVMYLDGRVPMNLANA